jgi:hypothetical protein
MRDGLHPIAKSAVMRAGRRMADRRSAAADSLARQRLAHLECRSKMCDSLSLGSGRHLFSKKILQSAVVELRLGQKARVLFFQRLQALCLRLCTSLKRLRFIPCPPVGQS